MHIERQCRSRNPDVNCNDECVCDVGSPNSYGECCGKEAYPVITGYDAQGYAEYSDC